MHCPPHTRKQSVFPAFLLLVATIVTADTWLEPYNSLFKAHLYAEASPALDSAQAVASISQDNSRNSKTISGKANKFGNEINWGFLNIHLSSIGYVGIGFSLIVGAIILSFFCSAKCKQQWRTNEQRRRLELAGETPPSKIAGPKDPREPREPGILKAVARRISNPPMSERAAAQMALMERINHLEQHADKLNGSQMDLNRIEVVDRATPTPAERRTNQERRSSTANEAVVEKANETALRLALQGVPAKHIIPRVIAEAKEEEKRMM